MCTEQNNIYSSIRIFLSHNRRIIQISSEQKLDSETFNISIRPKLVTLNFIRHPAFYFFSPPSEYLVQCDLIRPLFPFLYSVYILAPPPAHQTKEERERETKNIRERYLRDKKSRPLSKRDWKEKREKVPRLKYWLLPRREFSICCTNCRLPACAFLVLDSLFVFLSAAII